MSSRKTIVLSGDGSNAVHIMWTNFKEATGKTSTEALKILLQSATNSSEGASNAVNASEGASNRVNTSEGSSNRVNMSEASSNTVEPQIKINVDKSAEPTLKECVEQNFFLGTFKSVQELSIIFHNHAHVCGGQPLLVPSSKRTYTSSELVISCQTCGIKVLWKSSPDVGTSPLSDHRVGVGLHLAGINPAKVQRLLESLGMELWQPHSQSNSNTVLSDVVEELTEDSCNAALSEEDKENLGLSFDARYQQRTDANNTTVVFVSPITHKVCVVVNINKGDDRCDISISTLIRR